MSKQWYALHVKPHKERVVGNRLRKEELAIFCPMLRTASRNGQGLGEKPFFPGYIFVEANLERLGVNFLRWLPGTVGVITFGDYPAIIPANVIAEVRRRVAQINAAGGLAVFKFKTGDRVKVIKGPFTDYEGIFDTRLAGKDRVQILLAFLSKHPQPVKLDPSAIIKVNERVQKVAVEQNW